MTYFNALSLILGILTVVTASLFFICPGPYSRWILSRCYPEKRSWGHGVFILAWTLIVFYSWKKFFDEIHLYALIVCMVVTLGLVKSCLVFFYYSKFRPGVVLLLTQEKLARSLIAASAVALGVGLVVLSFFL